MTSSMPRPGRRWRLTPVIALAAILTLTGCASTGDSGKEGAAAPQSSGPVGLLPAAEGTTTYPLTLTTWAGESVLKQRPERIAVFGESPNLDALQALGVTPVYTITEDPYPWRDTAWVQKIEKVDTATRKDPINFEGIAATKPDLIIAVGALWEKTDFAKLADIAPVLDTKEQAETPWRDLQRLVGSTLDLAAAADKAVGTAEQAIAETARTHPQFAGKTITIGNDYGPQYGLSYFTAAGGIAEGILGDLGFKPGPNAAKFVQEDVVSDENQSLLDADLLVVVYIDEATRKAREAKPLFKALKPVSEGRYISLAAAKDDPNKVVDAAGKQLDNATWVLRLGASAVSLPWGVKVVADQWLAGAKLS
jgi:iron complex transport system substrate-binding protein